MGGFKIHMASRMDSKSALHGWIQNYAPPGSSSRQNNKSTIRISNLNVKHTYMRDEPHACQTQMEGLKVQHLSSVTPTLHPTVHWCDPNLKDISMTPT